MMKRHQPRWLAWLLILCIWMSSLSLVAAEAEEVSPSTEQETLVIALDLRKDSTSDSSLYDAAMSLLKPALRIAKQRKCKIRVLETVGNLKTLFSGQDSGSAERALDRVGAGTISSVQQHLAQTATALSAEFSDGARGHLFMVSRLDRLDRTNGQQRYVNEFYNAFKSLLDRAPGLSIHFVWLSDKKATAPVDAELSSAYPGRVTAIVLSQDNADELIAQELIQMAGTTFTLPQPTDGITVQDKTMTIPFTQGITSDVLLQIGFADGDLMPTAVKLVTPDGQEDLGVSEEEIPDEPEPTEDTEAAATATPEVLTFEPEEETTDAPESTEDAEAAATATPEVPVVEPEEATSSAPEPTEAAATATPEVVGELDMDNLPAAEIPDASEPEEDAARAAAETPVDADMEFISVPRTAEDTATATPEVVGELDMDNLPAAEIPDASESEEDTEATATATPEATAEPAIEELPPLGSTDAPEQEENAEDAATAEPEAVIPLATDEPVETEIPVVAPVQSVQPQFYIDKHTHTVWMIASQLPQGDYHLELTFPSETGEVQPTLTMYLLNQEPELKLSVEQADGETEAVLFHEPHTLTLTVDFPMGTFTPMPLDFQWLEVAAEEAPSATDATEAVNTTEAGDAAEAGDAGNALPQMEWTAVSGEDEGYRWQLTIPEEALPDEHNARIQLQASATCQEAGDRVFQTEPLTLTVVNRAPAYMGGQSGSIEEASGKVEVSRKVYYGVPGQTEATRISFDLSRQVEDPDGDSLVYAIDGAMNDSVRSACEMDSATGQLSVTLTSELITMQTLTVPVTVRDNHQGSLRMEVVIRLQPFENVLKSFRLVPVRINGENIPENLPYPTGSLGVNTLVYRLEGDLEGYAEARRQVPMIPPITEWIELSVDESVALKDNLQWNDDADQPELTLTLNNVTQHQDIAINLEANIVDSTGGLKIPVEVGPVTIKVANSKPTRTEHGPSETVERKAGIGGMPGHFTGITFGQIFEGENTDLTQLFADKDTPEALRYFVRTNAPVDLPEEVSDFDGAISNGLPVYALEQTDDLRNITVTQPGDYTFEVFAWDGEYVSESVRYTVTVTSLFVRNLTIALIALAAVALLLVIGLALRYALLPSFAGTAVEIDRDHRQATIRQTSPTYSTLALSRYRKKPISLMTALIASGQFLPSAVPAEALMDIMLLPGKNNTIGISVGSHAAQAGVCVQYGSQMMEGKGKMKHIATQQPVQILMNQARITLIVKAIRR